MKLKIQIGALLLTLIVMACSNQKKDNGWDVTIKGKVNKPQSGVIEIQELTHEGTGAKDTIVVQADNTFTKKMHITEPGYYQVNFYGRQFVSLILNKTDIEVNADGDDQSGFYDVKGSPEIDLIRQIQKLISDAQSSPEIAALEGEYQLAIQSGDKKKIEEILIKNEEILGRSYLQVAELIKKQPASLGVVNILQANNVLDHDEYLSVYIDAADKLKKEWPTSKHTKEFNEMVDKIKATAIGQLAPEIALPNPEGQVVKLSSLRGKYVLVDFWAKWCGPCRAENPYVVKAYHAFKDKGFEVYGVSLDRTKEDWVQAIQEDGLTWTHVSDLKYFESQAAHDYNISGIPFSILVDPDGKIIAKDLRGPQLEKKLEEIFNAKKG